MDGEFNCPGNITAESSKSSRALKSSQTCSTSGSEGQVQTPVFGLNTKSLGWHVCKIAPIPPCQQLTYL